MVSYSNSSSRDANIGDSSVDQVDDSYASYTMGLPSGSSVTSSFSTGAYTDARGATFIEVGRDQITYVNNTSEVKEILSALKPVGHSGHYVQPCMEGTRENILTEIDTWLEDFHARNILWIKGSPGSGKSAIASSLASRLRKRGRMGSNFAFKRGNIMLSDPAALWRTIAHDLARYNVSFASILVEVLKCGKVDPASPDIASHFESLIMEPLVKTHEQSSPHDIPVIIIDALDECGSDPSQTDQRKALLVTLTHWSRLSGTFKLIVTGRDERVPGSFRSCCKQIELLTGENVSIDVNQDIRRFFVGNFTEIGGPSLVNWPGERVLDILITRAAGLFIWAETVVRFVEQGLPDEQLEHILDGDLGDGDNVTKLYRQILEFLFRDANGRTLHVFNQVMAAIILAKIPLHVNDLPQFVLQPKSSINFILNKLSSVVSVGNDSGIRISHLSFAEFMCDPRRCPQPFYIDICKESRNISMICFRLMKDGLKFNICDLETSHVLNRDVDDLSERTAKKIQCPLLYSCRFWAAHTRDTPTDSDGNAALIQELKCFFYCRFLYWLEVMSIMKEVTAANTALRAVAGWIDPFDAKLSDFVRDGSRFIVNFFVPIRESTPHIYVSALAFSPKDSLVAKQYRPLFSNTLSIISGHDRTWATGINVLRGHTDDVSSVAFSSDGKQIASGSHDKSIRVWDAETGEIVSGPFEGHMDRVWSVAFSPDGKRIVSGSADKSIRIWDVETGEMVAGPLEGHMDEVQSVTFSSDGKRIASGSHDKCICVWDAKTGELSTSLIEGHTDEVNAVTFSSDGKRIASGSSDKSVRVWDAETGEMVCGPFHGHTDYVRSVAFSPDDKRIASGSDDQSIRVWDAETGQIISAHCDIDSHTDYIWSVAFSPDGKRIASGSSDESVRVWDAVTGEMVSGPFEGHMGIVWSVAFSPDGKQIASGSDDKSIYVWDAETGGMVFSHSEGHTHYIHSVAFSSDGKRIASGSSDKSIRVWDAETGEMVCSPFEGHTNYVLSVAFSSDGNRIVSGSSDMSICVWDAQTGELVSGPFQGHTGSVRSVTFSSDGRRIASGSSDKTIRIWNSKTGKILSRPCTGHTGRVQSVAFSSDGKRIVSGSHDKSIRIWNARTGKMVSGPFEGHTDYILSVAFSSDGKRIASGSSDTSIRVWDAKTGEMVSGPFNGHTNSVCSIAFSPDSKYLASGSSDQSICIWDAETGEIVSGPFEGHTDAVNSVTFSFDGKRIASGSSDKTVRVWDTEIDIRSHQEIFDSIGGARSLSCFHTPGGHKYAREQTGDGWVCSQNLVPSSITRPALIFWAPHSNRKGLCGINTLLVCSTRTTRLDLSRFVHGTSWARCYTPRANLCPQPRSDTSTIPSHVTSHLILSHPSIMHQESMMTLS